LIYSLLYKSKLTIRKDYLGVRFAEKRRIIILLIFA